MIFTNLGEIRDSDFEIPKLSDEKLIEMCKTIKVVIKKNDELFYIEPVDPRKTAFTWDPKITEKAEGLKTLMIIYTLHSSYPLLFKPSMDEVFGYIQDIPDIIAFCTEMVDESGHISLCAHPSGSGVIGKTTLYIHE